SDEHGVFAIQKKDKFNKLIISYAGFQSDSVTIKNDNPLQVVLAPDGLLSGITIKGRSRTTYINANSEFRTFMINPKDLLKAACCNLGESFETNPSVDVTYNDAVTGSKQIQLLGLSGNYTQLTVENLPGPRGLATPLGLNSIAGPWIESIQLTKGIGSVANGYESIAGQINIELKKPTGKERLFANMYVNDFGKTDLNLNLATRVGKKWSTGLLLHDDFILNRKLDENKDGFRDLPTGNQFNFVNRWHYDGVKGLTSQFGIKFLNDERTGGQTNFDRKDKFTTNSYGIGINTKRYEAFGKIGYVFPGRPYKSVGLQLSGFTHEQDAFFGLNSYNGRHENLYLNLIYQSIIRTTMHKFRTGISFTQDKYEEQYKGIKYNRTEAVPGAFLEYTFSPADNFNLVAGIRADHNSIFGFFATPRLHVRYEPISGTTIRLSAGRGQRTANIFAENIGALASSRLIMINEQGSGKAYGLEPEVAWNKGISVDQKLRLFNRTATIGIDFFRNDFENQVVLDLEDPSLAAFSNPDGKSYSNSFQAELTMEPVKSLEARFAYRFFDVKSMYGGKLQQRPLIS